MTLACRCVLQRWRAGTGMWVGGNGRQFSDLSHHIFAWISNRYIPKTHGNYSCKEHPHLICSGLQRLNLGFITALLQCFLFLKKHEAACNRKLNWNREKKRSRRSLRPPLPQPAMPERWRWAQRCDQLREPRSSLRHRPPPWSPNPRCTSSFWPDVPNAASMEKEREKEGGRWDTWLIPAGS